MPSSHSFSHFLLICTLCAGSAGRLHAQSQSTPLTPVLALTSQGPNGLLSSFDAELGTQCDVIFGRSGVASYPLSWRGVRQNTETVVVDGQTLKRDLDYTFDNVSGTLRFTRPPGIGVMARITYRVDTPGVARNTPASGAPLSWDLWQSGANHLRLRMQPQPGDGSGYSPSNPAQDTSFGRNALQWNGNNRLIHLRSLDSQLESKLFVDLEGGDLTQRSGFSLANRNRFGRTDVNLSYARAGALFTQSSESGIASGTEIYEAKISTVAAIEKNNLTISGGFRQSTQLSSPQSSPVTTSTATTASGSTTGTLPSTAPTTITETNASVALELTALQKTKVTANVSDRYQQDGLYRTGAAKVQLPKLPIGQTQITGGVEYSSDPHQERLIGLLSASMRPHRYLEVSGDARLRDSILPDDVTNPNALNTYAVNLKFVPLRVLTITGGVTLNPEQDGTPHKARHNSVGLTTTMGDFIFRGQFGLEEDLVSTHSTDTSEFGLDVRLTRFDRLSTGFRGQNFFDHSTPGTYTYLLGYTRRLGSFLDLSLNGSYTLPTFGTDPTRTEVKTEARLGLKF